MNLTAHCVPGEEVMALYDGELSPDRAQAVSAHLTECIECQEIARRLSESHDAVASWSVADIPVSAVARMEVQLEQSAGVFDRTLKPRGRRLATALAAVTCILLAFAVAIPNLLRSRMAANEASAVGSLRTLNTAAATYVEKYGHYPGTLENFGPPSGGEPTEEAADLIDRVLAGGRKSGYFFTYQRVPNFDARGGYSIGADPIQPGTGGTRRFSTDQTGVIRANGEALDGPVSAQKSGPGASGNDKSPSYAGPMIARAAELKVGVERLDGARESMERILRQRGGYIAQLSVSGETDSGRVLVASLRIPTDQLDPCVAELKKLGRVSVESRTGEEITQQHVDLVARLQNARRTEARINDVIQHRTGSVKEVLEAETESARVRGEIESMEAERKVMENRVPNRRREPVCAMR